MANTVLQFNQKPSLFKAYFNVMTPGRAKYTGIDQMPRLAASWNGAVETPERIRRYREACGFGNDGILPLLYPHVFTSAMHIHILADKRFPVSAFGAVHARNHIIQHKRIPESDSVDLYCYFSGARVIKAGLEIDIVTTVSQDGGIVWESISSYIFRGKRFGEPGEPHKLTEFEELGEPDIKAQWHVPRNMGRRYASITGDYNPIHVSKVLARAFGFKRDIIHGMWVLAKCLAHLDDYAKTGSIRLDVAFKGPVFMESTCYMKGCDLSSGFRFDVFCEDNPRPSLVCRLKPESSDAHLLS